MSENAAPTLRWNIPNLITVTLMVVLTFAVVGFLYRAAVSFAAPKPAAKPVGEVGDLS